MSPNPAILTWPRPVGGGDPLDAYAWEWRFEADALSGGNGDPIGTWADTSGNSRDATEATNRPTLVTGAFGALPGLTFGASAKLKTGAIAALTQPTTLWVVATAGGSAGFKFAMDGLTVSTRNAIYFSGTSSALAFAGSSLTSSPSGGVNSPRVYVAVLNGGSSTLRSDGHTLASGNAGTQTLTGLTLGARYDSTSQASGNLGAVLVAAGAMSTADMNAVGTALADKYGTTWTEIT